MKLYIAMLLLGTTINAQDNQEHHQQQTENVSTGYSTLQKAALITGVIGVMLAAPFTPLVFKENRDEFYDALLKDMKNRILHQIKNKADELYTSTHSRIPYQLERSLGILATETKRYRSAPFYIKPLRSFVQPAAMAVFSSLCQEFIDAEAHQTISRQYAYDVLAAVKKNIPEADIEKNQPIKKLIEILTETTSS